MPDNKLTDNEIVKALEDWIKNYDGSYVNFKTLGNTLDLINRQKAEIEEFKSAINGFRGYEDKIKAEAYKEFANELICRTHEISCNTAQVVTRYDIDNLLKELVGDDNASKD